MRLGGSHLSRGSKLAFLAKILKLSFSTAEGFGNLIIVSFPVCCSLDSGNWRIKKAYNLSDQVIYYR